VGEVAEAGDRRRVEITKTDAYDLVGRVVEFCPVAAGAPRERYANAASAGRREASSHRTGAPLRVWAEIYSPLRDLDSLASVFSVRSAFKDLHRGTERTEFTEKKRIAR